MKEYDLVERSKVYSYLPKHISGAEIATTGAELDIWNKAVDEAHRAVEKVPKAMVDVEALTKTEFVETYSGAVITYAECRRCRQNFTYLTDNPFNCCPYCMARRE